MKKSALALSLVVLAAGAAWYFVARLDQFVQRSIERVGTEVAGSTVRVEQVDIDLRGATATLRGLSLANPEGFSEASLLRFDAVVLTLDPRRLNRDNLGITSIVVRNTQLRYEQSAGQNNLAALRAGLPAPAEQETSRGTADTAPGTPQVSIDHLLLAQVEVALYDPRLPAPVAVDLGDFVLQDLAGTPTEVAEQLLAVLLAQLSDKAAAAMLAATASQLGADARNVGRQVLEQAGQGLRAVGESLGEAGGRVREGLGRLFTDESGEPGETPQVPQREPGQ